MIIAAGLGAGIGLGCWLSVRAAVPRTESAQAVLIRLAHVTPVGAEAGRSRVPEAARRAVEAVGVDLGRRVASLALVDRTAEQHALDKLVGGLVGLALPAVVVVGLAAAGIRLPAGFGALVAVALGVGGFQLADFRLRDEVDDRRQAFRHALSSYLDLVNVLLAGGAGIETALHAAADAGDGWGFEQIRHALSRARLTGQTAWEAFGALGERLQVNELSELAASVALAGSQGARIRGSLAAKADTLRGHQVAETEAAAEAATERMTIPVAVLLFGFLVFIVYPAIHQITHVGGPTP